jgi:hypothetical protein
VRCHYIPVYCKILTNMLHFLCNSVGALHIAFLLQHEQCRFILHLQIYQVDNTLCIHQLMHTFYFQSCTNTKCFSYHCSNDSIHISELPCGVSQYFGITMTKSNISTSFHGDYLLLSVLCMIDCLVGTLNDG